MGTVHRFHLHQSHQNLVDPDSSTSITSNLKLPYWTMSAALGISFKSRGTLGNKDWLFYNISPWKISFGIIFYKIIDDDHASNVVQVATANNKFGLDNLFDLIE